MTIKKTATKLTTHEVADSLLLMTMIASTRGGKSRTAERIVKTAEADLRSNNSADAPVYDVRVSINGVELDFRDFAEEVQRQLDDMVMREAGELLKQTVGDKLNDLINDTHTSLKHLHEGVKQKAVELLGYNPWKDE